MLVEQRAPLTVTEFRSLLRGINDVGEHDGREHAIGLDLRPRASQELLDLVYKSVYIANPRHVIGPWKLYVLRSRNRLTEKAPSFNIDPLIAVAVKHEGRHSDRRQDMANVDFVVHAHQRDSG